VAVDFFSQQDRARRNTRLLVFLFAVAVLALVALTNALVAAFLWLGDDYNLYAGRGRGLDTFLELLSWERFGTIGLTVVATVGLVSLLRWLQLASGGKAVAESMGGRRILPQTDDPDERRALNVVEELALAANMPVPPLYLLPDERGINAFAAGITPADAVVAVTRGTLLQLRRDELQGVIGHEFSHILNGDMRLGIRLAALLKGITFIGDVGHFLLRAGAYGVGRSHRQSSERSAALPILGLGLLVIGWIGSLSAGFIKAAISRQKEFLADASAVQFTRDNRGIANALKVIGGFIPGSLVQAARAAEMSHIFFGEVRHSLWEGFSTHPPLERRILRLDPQWDGEFIQRKERRYGLAPLSENLAQAGVSREALVMAAAASLAVADDEARDAPPGDADFADAAPADAVDDAATALAPGLNAAIHDPLGATALALALLIVRQPGEQETLLELVGREGVRGQAEQARQLLPTVRRLDAGERFPVLAAAMPALKALSTPQYRQFKTTLLTVIRADQRTDLFEWCLFQLLRHYLDPEYLDLRASRPRYAHLARVRGALRTVLSVLAHHGDGSSERAFATAAAALQLEGLTLLPRAECSVAAFSKAVHTLADCYPLLKPRILKAMALAAGDDGEVSATEREIVIAVAAVMDCPLPDAFALAEAR
jgi:Zn-dependent protease with chaperone function